MIDRLIGVLIGFFIPIIIYSVYRLCDWIKYRNYEPNYG